MIGANAGGIITLVKNMKTVRDGAVGQFPCDAMGTDHWLTLWANPNQSIPIGACLTRPDPTGITFLYLRPETIRDRFGTRFSCGGET